MYFGVVCISFGQVTDVEFDSLFIGAVLDGKVEPIDVTSGIRVNSQEEIVLGI